jgi:hypothetical protein
MEQYIQEKLDNSNDSLFEKNNYNFNNTLSKQSNNYKYCENILDFESNDSIIRNNSDKIILKKKKLIEITKNLTKVEYLEIFNIIKSDNCQYSENKNGIFINLSNVSEKTIDKIFDFINFFKQKNEDLVKHEEIVNNTKKNIIEINKNNDNVSNECILQPISKIIEYNEYEDNEDKSINSNNYLIFSSDEDEDIENKISLKKKKTKYSGKKAKMIKSIRDSNDINKNKNKFKKDEE